MMKWKFRWGIISPPVDPQKKKTNEQSFLSRKPRPNNLHSQSLKLFWNPRKIQELRDSETLQDSLDHSRRLNSRGSPNRLQRRNKAQRRVELTSWRYRRPGPWSKPSPEMGGFLRRRKGELKRGCCLFHEARRGVYAVEEGRSSPEQKAGARVPRETFFRSFFWDLMRSLFCSVSINWTRSQSHLLCGCTPYFCDIVTLIRGGSPRSRLNGNQCHRIKEQLKPLLRVLNESTRVCLFYW